MSEKTRLTIDIPAGARMNIPLIFKQSAAGGVTVNWGDKTAPQQFETEGLVKAEHTYAAEGRYVIEMSAQEECSLVLGASNIGYSILGESEGYRQMLTEAEIGNDANGIGEYAFRDCGKLERVTLSEGLFDIGKYAFEGCCSLREVALPESIAVIRTGLFFGCTALEKIGMPKNVAYIEDFAFYNCCALEEIELGSTEEIGTSAFQDCRKLRAINLPETLQYIGESAFESCAALQKIIIPQAVRVIERQTFANCRAACEIEVASLVRTIGAGAFKNCTFAHEIRFLSAKPPVMTSPTALDGLAEDCVIRVPEGTEEVYRMATNWTMHARRIGKEGEA